MLKEEMEKKLKEYEAALKQIAEFDIEKTAAEYGHAKYAFAYGYIVGIAKAVFGSKYL